MKSFYSILITFCFTVSGMSQPIISNIQPAIGDHFLYTRADNTDYTPGEAGADMYWDYSDLYAQALNDLNYTILAPSEGEEHESFPNATSVWYRDNLIENSRHIYRSFENNIITTYGSIIVSSAASSYGHKYYDDKEAWLTFPMSYLDSGSDSYTGHYTSELFGQSVDFSGTTSYTIDGYGTVETQYGVFENALRVKITEVEQVLADTFNNYHNTRYTSRTEWYSGAFPVPVLMTLTSYEVENEGTIYEETSDTLFQIGALATYNDVATAVDNIATENTLRVYPNPATDYLILDAVLSRGTHLKIFSSDGKLVHEELIGSRQKIDISGLSPGYYIANLHAQYKTFSPVSFVVH